VSLGTVSLRAVSMGGRRLPMTLCVMMAVVMQSLDVTIANVSLPYMQGSLQASQDQISWVLTSYIVAAAVMILPAGWLSARFGRKRVFLGSVAGFVAASVLCGAAGSLEQMVMFRLLQGCFGAALGPLAQAVMLDTYPHEQRGSAMALFGMGVMVGPIMGPTLGGLLTEAYNWRWVFYINVPVGLLVFAGLASFLEDTPPRHDRRFDLLGFTMLTLAIGALQMLLDRGVQLDWFDSTEIRIEAALVVFGLYMTAAHMLTAERSFVDKALFGDRNLLVGMMIIFMLGIVMLGTLALLTPFLQTLMSYPVMTAGLTMAPRGIGTMISMLVVGRLIGRIDRRLLILTGLSLAALALWEMSGFTTESSQWAIIRSGFVQGVGVGLVFVPLSTSAFASLPAHLRTEGTAIYALMRNLGQSFGVSAVTANLVHGTQSAHAVLVEGVTPFNPLFRPGAIPGAWNIAELPGRHAFDLEVTHQAMAIAFGNDFRLLIGATAAAMLLLLLMRRLEVPGK
jgi:DHA2 family multidrug resistance protein